MDKRFGGAAAATRNENHRIAGTVVVRGMLPREVVLHIPFHQKLVAVLGSTSTARIPARFLVRSYTNTEGSPLAASSLVISHFTPI